MVRYAPIPGAKLEQGQSPELGALAFGIRSLKWCPRLEIILESATWYCQFMVQITGVVVIFCCGRYVNVWVKLPDYRWNALSIVNE